MLAPQVFSGGVLVTLQEGQMGKMSFRCSIIDCRWTSHVTLTLLGRHSVRTFKTSPLPTTCAAAVLTSGSFRQKMSCGNFVQKSKVSKPVSMPQVGPQFVFQSPGQLLKKLYCSLKLCSHKIYQKPKTPKCCLHIASILYILMA